MQSRSIVIGSPSSPEPSTQLPYGPASWGDGAGAGTPTANEAAAPAEFPLMRFWKTLGALVASIFPDGFFSASLIGAVISWALAAGLSSSQPARVRAKQEAMSTDAHDR